eukprot:1285730-Alexandrium_andersonii.AAC.1
MSASLVGSEMCIRDRTSSCPAARAWLGTRSGRIRNCPAEWVPAWASPACLLYTSDAADDM